MALNWSENWPNTLGRLINVMSCSDDMGVRDKAGSANGVLIATLPLLLSDTAVFSNTGASLWQNAWQSFKEPLTIAANQGHSFGSAIFPPTMRLPIFFFSIFFPRPGALWEICNNMKILLILFFLLLWHIWQEGDLSEEKSTKWWKVAKSHPKI